MLMFPFVVLDFVVFSLSIYFRIFFLFFDHEKYFIFFVYCLYFGANICSLYFMQINCFILALCLQILHFLMIFIQGVVLELQLTERCGVLLLTLQPSTLTSICVNVDWVSIKSIFQSKFDSMMH